MFTILGCVVTITSILISDVFIGPSDYTEDLIKKDFYVMVDSKSKDETLRHKSSIIRELFVDDPNFLPGHHYYIHSRFNIKILQVEDNQYEKLPKFPCFKFGKNDEWTEFAPYSFMSAGCPTLSVYYLCKWYNEELKMNATGGYPDYNKLEVFNWFPENFIDFYQKTNFVNNIPNHMYEQSEFYKFKLYREKHKTIIQDEVGP